MQKKEQNVGIEKVIFSKPVDFEGETYNELILDFESLSGKDLIDADKETRIFGENAPVLEFNKTYQAVIAAKASKKPVDLILSLPAKEFTKVTLLAQNFLLD